MRYVNLLGAHTDYANLRLFANAFFDALEITDGEERESANYVDGYYLKGSCGGMVFVVALSDEAAHEDLPYWIHISAEVGELGDLEAAVSQLMRDKALPAGFRLAHIANFGKRGEQRIDY
ncbi:hypothetical protein [Trinickia fusca]|uniref:Uncharacterized protein n=1 Tax=Trinickia fusca TaxID=2419777 RepID=A0A494X5C7_9BURK|nr:hypothetical protein [Trinickia fusca]RKP45888.1 hypothetical protein D7S89_18020 [Trinickia fusca]